MTLEARLAASKRNIRINLGPSAALGTRALGGLISGRGRYFRALTTFAEVLAIYGRMKTSQTRTLEQAHRDAAARVARLCRRNGATWVKAAQFLSCRPDILPQAYIDALAPLQNDAQVVHFDQLKPALINAWGDDWTRHFEVFDLVPVATASIAQVHHARLKTGEEVAVKVRLPEVAAQFDQDASLFRLLARLAAPLVRELDVIQITEQLLTMTATELDFRNEAGNLRRFARLPHPPGIQVPPLFDELSGEATLVTGWVQGQRLRDYLAQHPDQAQALLGRLVGSYLQQVTRFGLYQADPHPGNFLVDEQGTITILDYGVVGRLTPDEVRRYSRLLFGLLGFEGEVDMAELFREAGFVGGDAATLEQLSRYVLTDQLNREHPVQALQALQEALRAQRIQIPDSYIGISRVLITLGGLMMAYGVPFDWTPPERRP